ncbi:nuclease-related domain-containing protein [Pseudarthrobacter sp. R1]|uniref:nuclease-related domain-containing protein n=1 Tax=Pseudarthrobacter sp. R1 TaxID=2944934 RepID=UPI0035A874C7
MNTHSSQSASLKRGASPCREGKPVEYRSINLGHSGGAAVPQDVHGRIVAQSSIEKLLAGQKKVDPWPLVGRILGVDPWRPSSQSRYREAVGQVAVGRLLEQLSHEWTVLHSVPIGAGSSDDVDHVVIGPGGVYTVRTRSYIGQAVCVSGQTMWATCEATWVAGQPVIVSSEEQKHIGIARCEASKVALQLATDVSGQVPVTGIIVIVHAKSVTIQEGPSDVVVLTDRQLLGWLNARPRILAPQQLQQVSEVAVEPRTWPDAPVKTSDPAHIGDAFSALQRAVDTSRSRQVGWLIGLVAGMPLLWAIASRLL